MIFFCLPSGSKAASGDKLFHIRYDVETANGQFIGTRLSMIPAENEYRTETFEIYKITGKSDPLPEADIVSSATNNAFKTLLTEHGLKSISSKHILFNLISTDKSVMSYEGVIKYPCNILHEGYLEGQEIYVTEMEVWFSPVSFPDTWSYLYIKYKVREAFADMISVFN